MKFKRRMISIAICVMSVLYSEKIRAGNFPFNGTWTGKGQILDNDVKSECESIKFNIIQNETELRFEKEEFLCGEQRMIRKYIYFEIRGNELWVDNRKAGTITEAEFFIDILDQLPKSFVQLAGYGSIENGRFRYSEIIHYRFDTEAGSSSIAAEMRLQSQP